MPSHNKTFAKLFMQMYESTIAEDWQGLITFQQLCILCDWYGIIDMTPRSISRLTCLPQDIIEAGLKTLEQPDPDSRTKECEGRRIVRLDPEREWGWQIVNFEKYRDLIEPDSREQHRQYMQRYRERKAAEEAEAEQKRAERRAKRQEKQQASPPEEVDKQIPMDPADRRFKFNGQVQIPEDFCITHHVRNWCQKNQHKPRPEDYFDTFVSHFKAKGTRWKDWDQTFINWIRDSLPGGRFYKAKPGQPDHVSAPAKKANGKSDQQKRQELVSEIRYAQDMMARFDDPAVIESWQQRAQQAQQQLNQLEKGQ